MKEITPLSLNGRRLLEAIVQFIKSHKVDYQKPATYPTYDKMYRSIVPDAPPVVVHVGHNLRKKGLDELNEWTQENVTIPKVTGLIVDGTTRRPGTGFFPSHNKQPKIDDDWWHEEVRKAVEFDWCPYIGTQVASSPPLIAEDVGADESPERVTGMVSRVVRDTKLVRQVKALHNQTCQLCGLRLKLSPGRFYSEGHHLRPLGKPHNGPDRISNIICVCPNCHVKLDYRTTRISYDKLKTVPGHTVAKRFVDFHNANCG